MLRLLVVCLILLPALNAHGQRTSADDTEQAQLVAAAEVELRAQRFAEARTMYETGLRRAEVAQSHWRARYIERLARLSVYTNDLIEAEVGSRRATTIANAEGSAVIEADALRVLGVIHRRRGEYRQAVEALTRSENLHAQVGDTLGVVKSKMELGVAFGLLGEGRRGLGALHEASVLVDADLVSAHGDEAGRLLGFIHHNMAQAQERLGAWALSKENYLAAMRVWLDVGDRQLEALTRTNIARGLIQEARTDEAEPHLTIGQEIAAEIGDRKLAAQVQLARAEADERANRLDEALARRLFALAVHTELQDLEALWRDWAGLSALHERLGDKSAAIAFASRAVDILRAIRTGVSGTSGGATSYYNDKRPIFEALVRLLVEAGRTAEAAGVLDLLKAEEQHEFSGRRRSSDADARALTHYKNDERFESIVELAKQLLTCPDRTLDADILEECRLAEETLKADYLRQVAEIEQLYADVGSRVENRELGEKQLEWVGNLANELKGDHAEPGTVVIRYLATPDTLYIFATGARSKTISRRVDIENHELFETAYELLDRASMPPKEADSGEAAQVRDLLRSAQHLHAWLIAPIAEYLDAEREALKLKANDVDAVLSLKFHLDDALRYVPIAALHDGDRWLIERNAVSVYLAGAGRVETVGEISDWVAALGVTEGHGSFSPLPGVGRELESIKAALRDNVGADPADALFLLNADFDRQALKDAAYSYDVLHLATHFKFVPGSQADSALLLGNGDLINLTEIANIVFRDVSMAILSACETARGGSRNGSEVEGLGVELIKSNVRNVIATLWRIDDDSAADFMAALYPLLRRQGLTRAKAIREVQLAFLSAADATGDEAPDPKYAHPVYWAPYILMGNRQ